MKGLIIKLALVLVVGVISYNYFFGTPEEKESSRQIVGQVKALTSSVAGLLKSEKDKFDEGKYDTAIGKVKSALGTIHRKVSAMGARGKELMGTVESLEQEETELERQLQNLSPDDVERAREIRQQILNLNERTDSLVNRLDG